MDLILKRLKQEQVPGQSSIPDLNTDFAANKHLKPEDRILLDIFLTNLARKKVEDYLKNDDTAELRKNLVMADAYLSEHDSPSLYGALDRRLDPAAWAGFIALSFGRSTRQFLDQASTEVYIPKTTSERISEDTILRYCRNKFQQYRPNVQTRQFNWFVVCDNLLDMVYPSEEIINTIESRVKYLREKAGQMNVVIGPGVDTLYALSKFIKGG